MYNDPTRDRPAGPAGGGASLGYILHPGGPPHPTRHPGVLCAIPECPGYHSAPAAIWCRYCPAPATGDDEQCDGHREGVPATITDPWLVAQALHQMRSQRAKEARR